MLSPRIHILKQARPFITPFSRPLQTYIRPPHLRFVLPISPTSKTNATTTTTMPPKGSGKRKRAEPAKVDFTSLPKDLTPPPNFVLEKAGEDFPVKAGSANVVNPDKNPEILDAKSALRASPDADEITHEGEKMTEEFEVGKVSGTGDEQIKADDEKEKEEPVSKSKTKGRGRAGKTKEPVVKVSDKAIEDQVKREDSPLSSIGEDQQPPTKKSRKAPTKASKAAKKGSDEIKAFVAAQAAERRAVKKEDNTDGEEAGGTREDPDGDDTPKDDAETVKLEARRPPPIHSDYLPLPWKGRLGYACLNTYLRFSNPPVFASRTCRIASILDHRHPLADPTQPEHPTKNRPDKTQPASIERGRKYVESLGVANARDVIKMIRWNAKYGIRFMRLSSEMFPFASHDEYGYTLEPFAKEVLGEVGKVAGELNCRLTTHPGQFTQLGSPRQQVIDNAVRDLEYHAEMLSLLNMPEQLDRDAVMILHLGGVFGDKVATLQRFKENYNKLSDGVKKRLVLENDDVSWSVHDLLPVCEELNIPMVLDYHHHNIIFDPTQIREGTKEIMNLYPRIKATWTKKGITQKMHYSEPCPEAVTGRERRKHNPRPATLPPCADDMDLMIEAKDKEQAVFELMRTFKLPGWDTFNNIIPYERDDDNKPEPRKPKKGKKKTKKQLAAEATDPSLIEPEEPEDPPRRFIPEEEVGMGGEEGRVYWPPGMEEWLRPKKREVKKKGEEAVDEETGETDGWAMKHPTPMNLKQRQRIKAEKDKGKKTDEGTADEDQEGDQPGPKRPAAAVKKSTPKRGKPSPKTEPESEPELSSAESDDADADAHGSDFSAEETDRTVLSMKTNGSVRRTGRKSAGKGGSYKESPDGASASEMDLD